MKGGEDCALTIVEFYVFIIHGLRRASWQSF